MVADAVWVYCHCCRCHRWATYDLDRHDVPHLCCLVCGSTDVSGWGIPAA